jgi:arginyl-tRNA synthetase
MRDIRAHLESLVDGAVAGAIAAGDLPDVAVPAAAVERPKDSTHGDFASTLPLRLARAMMKPPPEIANAIARHLPADAAVEPARVAAPGFLNFELSVPFLQSQVEHVITHGPAFADLSLGAGKRAQVEFVSANPTGPLHVGNARGGAIGDALAYALEAAGYDVEREYYVNDDGTQTDMFGETLYARYQQLFGREVDIPADGYPGEYMIELAQEIRDEVGDGFLLPPGETAPAALPQLGIELMVRKIRQSLTNFGIHYDRWFSEKSLYEPEGTYETATAILREQGYLVKREGALWFTSSELGEDKDNVVVRSDGRPTYYASDIAYHYDKFVKRGFHLVIDVWGADHHGHVSRLKTATRAVTGSSEVSTSPLPARDFEAGGEVVRLSRGGEDRHHRRARGGGGPGCGALLLPAAVPGFADGLRPGPGGVAVERESGLLCAVRPRAAGEHRRPGGGAGTHTRGRRRVPVG